MIVVLFFVFMIFCIGLSDKSRKQQMNVLGISLVVLTFLIGFRGQWPDKGAYLRAFAGAPTIGHWLEPVTPISYSEKGYFYLAGLIKTIADYDWFYLTVMGAISMYLLYKNLKVYSLLPLIGLCNYIARFLLNRDFTQMRSSLAILLIVWASKYIYERKSIRFFLWILMAYQFHHMAVIALPMYFLYRLNLTKKKILIGLILAFILSQTLARTISGIVEQYSQDLNYETYTAGGYVDQALGLKNPMIYYQIIILLFVTFSETRLKNLTKYYYLYRSGYFYSTLILIFFCNYTALSGRTSTMFATYEIFLLPMLSFIFTKKTKWMFYIFLICSFTYFFFSKYYVTN